MNIKRFILASLAVFVSIQITDPIIHGVILGPVYESLKEVWRPDMMSKMWIMLLTSLLFSLLFVLVYIKGLEENGIAEGVRYGIIISLFMNGVYIFNQYVVYPVPFSLALQWFIYGTIQFIIYGIITAFIYKPKDDS